MTAIQCWSVHAACCPLGWAPAPCRSHMHRRHCPPLRLLSPAQQARQSPVLAARQLSNAAGPDLCPPLPQVPMMDGYRNQPFIENLLRPYTNKMVRAPARPPARRRCLRLPSSRLCESARRASLLSCHKHPPHQAIAPSSNMPPVYTCNLGSCSCPVCLPLPAAGPLQRDCLAGAHDRPKVPALLQHSHRVRPQRPL